VAPELEKPSLLETKSDLALEFNSAEFAILVTRDIRLVARLKQRQAVSPHNGTLLQSSRRQNSGRFSLVRI